LPYQNKPKHDRELTNNELFISKWQKLWKWLKLLHI